MSDQTTQPTEAEPTAPVDSPEAGADQTQQEIDWQKRAADNQAAFTRSQQELAELRRQQQDEEYRAKVAQEWLSQQGYTLPDDEPDEYEDPTAALQARIDQLEGRLTGREQQEQQAQAYSAYRESVDPQLQKLGVPEEFVQAVADIAFNEMPGIPNAHGGVDPDLQGAFQRFQEVGMQFASAPFVRDHVIKQWRETKPRSALTSQAGQPGTQVPNLDNRQSRIDWMTSQLQADE